MPRSKGRQKQRQSRRPYVPTPQKKKPKESPRWFGISILVVMGIGVLMIVLNYIGLMPFTGGTASNLWLWVGLGLIALGFGGATQWR
ncbi:MAG TPA: cell division protein CrgA [Actinomycetota bacterium]